RSERGQGMGSGTRQRHKELRFCLPGEDRVRYAYAIPPKRKPNPRTSVNRSRTAGQPRARRRGPANKGRHYPAEILTADEVRALIRACSNRAPTGVRNRALLVLLYRAGCRISEALRLLPKDLDRGAGTTTVLRGKGGKRRTIGLDPGAFAVVERWLDVRTKLGIS